MHRLDLLGDDFSDRGLSEPYGREVWFVTVDASFVGDEVESSPEDVGRLP